MNLLALVFWGAVAVLIDTAWVAVFRARPVGKFQVVRDTADTFSFLSNHGTFTSSQRTQTLSYVLGKQRGALKFSEVKGIEYRVNEEYALLEELFFGFDWTDLLSQYRDTVDWFSIAVVAVDGRRIPLYLSGRYTQREFLHGWYIELQGAFLARLGLLTDVEAQSREALETLQARLGRPALL
jgi:hypothetical protein